MLKKYKGEIIFFYATAVIALAVAAFLDLRIDIFLNNPKEPIAIWFRNTGEMPCRLICPVAGMLMVYLGEKKVHRILGLIINLGGSAYLGYHIARYFFVFPHKLAFGIVYGIGFGIMLLLFGRFIAFPERLKKPLFLFAVIAVIVMFAEISVIEVIKIFWGRVRFRDLLAAGSYDAFTAWYLPNGINGNKSFPSGHTAGAGMSYLMMLLPFLSKRWEKHRFFCFLLPLVYTSIVAFTRLVMGAHYLSDVTVGGVISFTLVLLTIKIIDKKYRLE